MANESDPVLGTEAIAKILQVAPRTVAHFIDRGLLPGYQLPGSKTRRVLRSELVAFCRRQGLPEPFARAAETAVRGYHSRPRKQRGPVE